MIDKSFIEKIEQPASRFVLRLRSGDGQPQAALFEGDGGAWKLEAIGRIRDWLRKNLSDEFCILA